MNEIQPADQEAFYAQPSVIARILKRRIKRHAATMIWGPPGVGKSDIVRQVAADLGWPVIDQRVVTLDAVDLRGIPMVKDGRTTWAIPDMWPTEGEGVLFLDEINAGTSISTMAACYQLVLDRCLGDYQLPDGWSIVCAGNRETDRASVTRMPTPMRSRLRHLGIDPDLDDWCKWALANGICMEIVAFLRFRPNLLLNFEKDKIASANPRTWEMASDDLSDNPPAEEIYTTLAGVIGDGNAVELNAFLDIWRKLPSPDAVILNPDTAPLVTNTATNIALMGALANKATPDNFENVIRYLNRVPDQEYSTYCVKDAVVRHPEVQNTGAFIRWASEHSNVLF